MPQVLLNYFKKYLQSSKGSEPASRLPAGKAGQGGPLNLSSIKNYVSDINLFLNWVSRTIQEDTVQAKHLTPAIITTYQNYLTQSPPAGGAGLPAQAGLNPATLKRHFSSLRRFGQFLVNTNRLDHDPAKQLTDRPSPVTLAQILEKYTDYLKHENLSNSTIKNYLSDLNQYLFWANKNLKLTNNNQIKRPFI